MRARWLPITLGVLLVLSLAGNLYLGYALLNDAVGHSYTSQVQREMQRERAELRSLRAAFCPAGAGKAAVEAWARQRGGEPFDKDGFTWLSDIAVQFDANGRMRGACLPSTWQSIDGQWDREFSECPPEPVC